MTNCSILMSRLLLQMWYCRRCTARFLSAWLYSIILPPCDQSRQIRSNSTTNWVAPLNYDPRTHIFFFKHLLFITLFFWSTTLQTCKLQNLFLSRGASFTFMLSKSSNMPIKTNVTWTVVNCYVYSCCFLAVWQRTFILLDWSCGKFISLRSCP